MAWPPRELLDVMWSPEWRTGVALRARGSLLLVQGGCDACLETVGQWNHVWISGRSFFVSATA
eukprot:12393825-Alexandrium_andersonii.AAC.1